MLGFRDESAAGVAEAASQPRSIVIAQRGVHCGEDFSDLMSALLTDVLLGEVSTAKAHAACRAGANLLKYIEVKNDWPCR